MNDVDLLKALKNIDDDMLTELLEDFAVPAKRVLPVRKKAATWKVALAAAILLPVLVLTGFAVANAPAGWWLLTGMSDSTETYSLSEYWLPASGLITEDERIRIETVGALQDGNAVTVGILTTVKQVESAMIEGSNFPVYGYCFDKIDVFLDSQKVNAGRLGYTYTDKNSWLQNNQFLMIYSFDLNQRAGSCATVELTDLGYLGDNGQFTLAEKGEWVYSFEIKDLDSKEPSWQRMINISVNGIEYEIQSISASIFGIQMTIKSIGAANIGDFAEGFGEAVVVYQDETERTINPVIYTELSQDEAAWDGTYRVSIEFGVLTPLDQIRRIELFGGQFVLGK